jgi:RNA polymerase sigma factor (sigma-70 family)
MPRVAIIYVCYRTAQYVRDVAEAIACLDYPKEQMTFFLLPGGSDDGIQEIIVNEILPRSEKDLPKTLLLDTGVKAGFGTNNNVGMRRALDDGYDYVFLHNGDLRLDKNTLAGLVEEVQEEGDTPTGLAMELASKLVDSDTPECQYDSMGVLHLQECIDALSQHNDRQAQTVELRIIGGLTSSEIAATLGVSMSTVARDLARANRWLQNYLSNGATQ